MTKKNIKPTDVKTALKIVSSGYSVFYFIFKDTIGRVRGKGGLS